MVQFRFFSRSKRFFELFGEAARNVHQGAKALQRTLEDFQGSPDQWRAIEEYEHEGDKIIHRVLQTLHQSSLTARDREDIHKLAAALDDVLDLIEGSAFRLVMYKVGGPTPAARQLADVLVRSTDQIVRGIEALPDADAIHPFCIEINRLENEADEISREAIAGLFDGEIAPLDVIKWKEIYETMETATDRAEDVADLLEEIVLKRS
jgi:predicted phosphate transport protein (TIGR00153 family)